MEAAVYLVNQACVAINPIDCFAHTPLDDAVRHKSTVLQALLVSKGGISGDNPQLTDSVRAMRVLQASFMEKQKADQVLSWQHVQSHACVSWTIALTTA